MERTRAAAAVPVPDAARARGVRVGGWRLQLLDPAGSYATAESLGINPDPKHGGVDDGVTYIVFSNAKSDPIESHDSAVSVGQQAAQQFLDNN